jgi:hypothetical protein
MTWISPKKAVERNFNSVLRETEDWMEFVFLTEMREQTLLTDDPKFPEKKVFIAFVLTLADGEIRLFRIGQKLKRDLLDLGYGEGLKCWRVKATRTGWGPFYSYEVQTNPELDPRAIVPDLLEKQRETVERLRGMAEVIDFRRDEKGQRQLDPIGRLIME